MADTKPARWNLENAGNLSSAELMRCGLIAFDKYYEEKSLRKKGLILKEVQAYGYLAAAAAHREMAKTVAAQQEAMDEILENYR